MFSSWSLDDIHAEPVGAHVRRFVAAFDALVHISGCDEMNKGAVASVRSFYAVSDFRHSCEERVAGAPVQRCLSSLQEERKRLQTYGADRASQHNLGFKLRVSRRFRQRPFGRYPAASVLCERMQPLRIPSREEIHGSLLVASSCRSVVEMGWIRMLMGPSGSSCKRRQRPRRLLWYRSLHSRACSGTSQTTTPARPG